MKNQDKTAKISTLCYKDLVGMYMKETGRTIGESPEAYRDWLEDLVIELIKSLRRK